LDVSFCFAVLNGKSEDIMLLENELAFMASDAASAMTGAVVS